MARSSRSSGCAESDTNCSPLVEIINLAGFRDARGLLIAADSDVLPFPIARFFAIRDVPAGARRAEHANLTCEEVLVCLNGRCSVEVRDGTSTSRFELDSPDRALRLPPMHWLVCEDFSSDAVLLVLAAEPYDPAAHVADWDDYLALVRERPAP